MRLLVALSPLGLLVWWALIKLTGWWVFYLLGGLYLLAIAAVASVGGITAAIRWLEERQQW